MKFRCGSWKVVENDVYKEVQNKLGLFAKKIVKVYVPKMKDDFQENGQI